MSEINLVLKHEEFMLIRELLIKDYGVKLKNLQISQVEHKLMTIALENNCADFRELYTKAKQKSGKRIVVGLIDAMKIPDVEWFQDSTAFTVFRNTIIPKYINELRTNRKTHCSIWSADCSTGQEPYSIAMIIDESLAHEPRVNREQFHVFATDTSPNALYNGISGRYNTETISKGLWEGYKEKYFTESEGIYEIKSELKNLITFKEFDLRTNFAEISTFDIIFCRDVLLNFSEDYKANFLKKIHMKLDPAGYFFPGMAVNIMKYTNSFDMLTQDKYVYYKPKM